MYIESFNFQLSRTVLIKVALLFPINKFPKNIFYGISVHVL